MKDKRNTPSPFQYEVNTNSVMKKAPAAVISMSKSRSTLVLNNPGPGSYNLNHSAFDISPK